MTADAELLQPSCPPRRDRSGCSTPRPASTACAAPRRASRAPSASWTSGSTRRRPPNSRTRRSGALEPAPGGTQVAVAAAAVAAGPAPHVELELAGLPDPAATGSPSSHPPACRSTRCGRGCRCACAPSATTSAAASPPTEPPPPPAPSPVHDYLGPGLARAAAGAARAPAAGRPGRGPLDRRPDGHADRALRPRRRPARTTGSTASPRRRTWRRRASARRCRRHARLVDFARERRPGRRDRRSTSTVAPERRPRVAVAAGGVAVDAPGSDLAFTLEAGARRATRGRRDPDLRLGRGSVLPAGGGDRVRAGAPAGRRPARATAGSRRAACSSFEVVDPDDAERAPELGAPASQPWPTRRGGARALPRAAAEPARRRWSTLTEVEPFADPLLGAGLALFRVRWRPEDALDRSLSGRRRHGRRAAPR